MANDDRNSLTADQNADQLEPEQKPDLTLLYKRRCRSDDIIQKAKHLFNCWLLAGTCCTFAASAAGACPGAVRQQLQSPLPQIRQTERTHQCPFSSDLIQ